MRSLRRRGRRRDRRCELGNLPIPAPHVALRPDIRGDQGPAIRGSWGSVIRGNTLTLHGLTASFCQDAAQGIKHLESDPQARARFRFACTFMPNRHQGTVLTNPELSTRNRLPLPP